MEVGRYARGSKAWGHCERCGIRHLLSALVKDGQYPDMLVCTECYDPKHPQERLPVIFDPVTLYDPTGDLDSQTSGDADAGEDMAPPANDQPEFDSGCTTGLGYLHDALVTEAVTDSYSVKFDTPIPTIDYDVTVYVETGDESGVFTQHEIDAVNQGGEGPNATTLHFFQRVTAEVGSRIYLGPQGSTGLCNAPPSSTVVFIAGTSVRVSVDPATPPSGTDR